METEGIKSSLLLVLHRKLPSVIVTHCENFPKREKQLLQGL